jgi:hypothetical protein
MPTIDLPYPQQGKDDKETIRNLTDVVVRLRKELEYVLTNLDHDNVTRLYTEYCQIRSEAGETQISGPLILMYDKQEPPVLRRKIGYDPDSTLFVDEWYNPSGVLTAYIDSSGKLIVVDGEFKGTIDIGGGNFTVDATGTVRIKKDVIIGDKLYLGTEAVNKALYMGLSFLECLFSGGKYNMHFSSNGYLNITSDGDMQIFSGTGVYPTNTWDFSSASVTGLEGSGYKSGNNTGSDSHSHTVEVDGITYTTSSESHSHSQT